MPHIFIPLIKRSRLWILPIWLMSIAPTVLFGQDKNLYRGTQVPPEVERIYVKGLKYLVQNQAEDGSFPGNYGSEPAIAGLAMLAMLAHGEDPNYGPYSKSIKRSLEKLLNSKKDNGYIGNSMYNHGFATLALAECYGVLNDDRIAPALQKAVDLILTSQSKNPFKAWRYSPESQDADSTVSGACFVALVAARNAGLKVPDKAIDDALKFYSDCQSPNDGNIGYLPRSGGHGGCTTAIGVAVYSYARKKDSTVFQKAFKAMKAQEDQSPSYPYYFEYYAAQAYFQGDVKEWQVWNEKLIKKLGEAQSEDGSWEGGMGVSTSTTLGLLSLALNYRYLPIYER